MALDPDQISENSPLPDFGDPIRLSSQQQSVFEALSRHHERLGTMYLGALITLADDNNPLRIYLGAHALRELIEIIPEHVDLSRPKKPPDFKSKVNELKPSWDAYVTSMRTTAGSQSSSSGNPLSKLLDALKSFFDWYGSEQLIRAERNAALVRGLEPSTFKLPKNLEQRTAKKWADLYKYFALIAHFKRFEDIAPKLNELEVFLIDMLAPRTFDEFADLEAIIREAEGR